MTMKRYHGHTLLYLHETIDLGSGRGERFSADERSREETFTRVFGDVYHPMMEELGARLFAIWETSPYNGHWPQVTIIWEIDAFADYARIGRAQARGGSHVETAAKWAAFLSEIGASGEGRVMYAGASNKTLAQLKESSFTAGLAIQEVMHHHAARIGQP